MCERWSINETLFTQDIKFFIGTINSMKIILLVNSFGKSQVLRLKEFWKSNWISPTCVVRSRKISLKSGMIQFPILYWIIDIVSKTTFYTKPNWNWTIGYKDNDHWKRGKNNTKQTILLLLLPFFVLCISLSDIRLIFISHITFHCLITIVFTLHITCTQRMHIWLL